MTPVRQARTAAWAFLAFAACAAPVHPNNPAIPATLCEPRCQRMHDCDPSLEVAACITSCEHHLSPRVVYNREDLVGAQRACAQQQACVTDVDRAIGACMTDAFRRLEPTPAARSFCQKGVEKDRTCGELNTDVAHCLLGHKMYSDAILAQLSDCLEDHPCRSYGLCILAVVGEDIAKQDPDRVAQFQRTPVPHAGPATVAVHGHVTSDAKMPVPGVTVCVHGAEPCATTDAEGAFTIMAPGHEDTAITAVAPGYAGRVIALATVGQEIKERNLVLFRDATMTARYSAFGARYPDPATGFVFVTALAPAGSGRGLEGVTMALAPASGKGPFFFAPNSDPDAKATATSTWSSGVFANIAPGEVEITLGPDAVTCVPWYGGWASTKPGSVRVPIVAGFETQVSMSCHK